MIDDDSYLRSHFKRLRAQDETSVFPFSAQNGGLRDRWSLNVPAIAAIVFLLIAASLVYFRSSRTTPIDEILRWRSPTAFLLKTSGDPLFTTMPSFRSNQAK